MIFLMRGEVNRLPSPMEDYSGRNFQIQGEMIFDPK